MSRQAIIKILLITVALLVGIIVGLVASIASLAAGSSMPAAISTGIGMFFVAMAVSIAVATFARS